MSSNEEGRRAQMVIESGFRRSTKEIYVIVQAGGDDVILLSGGEALGLAQALAESAMIARQDLFLYRTLTQVAGMTEEQTMDIINRVREERNKDATERETAPEEAGKAEAE